MIRSHFLFSDTFNNIKYISKINNKFGNSKKQGTISNQEIKDFSQNHMMMTLNLANEYDFCKFKGVVMTLFLEERL